MIFFDTIWHRWLRVPYSLHVHRYHNPRRYRDTVILLHGIGNSIEAWKEISEYLPHDIRVVAVDLLGFGKSPKPSWVTYDTKTQARSVMKTLFSLGITGKTIFVGHSLGALVSIDIGRRYPLFVKKLILCSPPIYRPREKGRLIPSRDDRLRKLYKIAKKHPKELIRLAPLATQVGLANKALHVDDKGINSYLKTLELSIVNQTALNSISKIKKPIVIFHGMLDPVVVGSNLKDLARKNSQIEFHSILTGHEIMGAYTKKLGQYLKENI